MADNLIDKLKELGLNSYEAKVYLALLKQSPATGYEISKESGVPQARAYDTLKALEANKIVVAMGGKPVTYTPICPNELLDRWEKSFKGSLEYLRETLPSLSNETAEPIINLIGDDTLFKHAIDMINTAERLLFLQVWREDAEKLAPALRAAAERGVTMRIVGYDNCQIDGVEVFPHEYSEAIEENYGFRWFILSVDNLEGLVGTIPVNGERQPQAIVTKNPGIVLLIQEYVMHDIFIMNVFQETSPQQINEMYGGDVEKVRQQILGERAFIRLH